MVAASTTQQGMSQAGLLSLDKRLWAGTNCTVIVRLCVGCAMPAADRGAHRWGGLLAVPRTTAP